MRILPAGLALALALVPSSAGGQARSERFAAPVLPVQAPIEPDRAFLASAVVPGLGQRMLGQDRWLPYIVVEAWGLLSWLRHRSDGRELERRYRDLAWRVARRVSVGERRDPAFEYYEALTHYEASGAFDTDAARAGVQPEPDVTTFNGNVWRLAKSLYVPGGANPAPGSPEHAAAIAYYTQNAMGDELAWAWGSSVLEQEVYTGLIEASDDAFRSATQALGLVVANHVVSAIDALISARLRAATGLDVGVRGGLDGAVPGARWRAELRIGW